ncbi:protamine-like [Ischnura elegans]|uniref:protamine-like n=1 Tax=Ischnura elegans TaxID=197161 RepID=UPI001ED8760C|nr:protamine-like [Ischnura elegans]
MEIMMMQPPRQSLKTVAVLCKWEEVDGMRRRTYQARRKKETKGRLKRTNPERIAPELKGVRGATQRYRRVAGRKKERRRKKWTKKKRRRERKKGTKKKRRRRRKKWTKRSRKERTTTRREARWTKTRLKEKKPCHPAKASAIKVNFA